MADATSASSDRSSSTSKPAQLINELLPTTVQQNRLLKFGLSIAGVIALIALTGAYTIIQTGAVFSPADHTLVVRNMLLIIGVAIIGLAAVGIGIARPTITEIERLESSAERIESGDLDRRATGSDPDTGPQPDDSASDGLAVDTTTAGGPTATADGGTDLADDTDGNSAERPADTGRFDFEST